MSNHRRLTNDFGTIHSDDANHLLNDTHMYITKNYPSMDITTNTQFNQAPKISSVPPTNCSPPSDFSSTSYPNSNISPSSSQVLHHRLSSLFIAKHSSTTSHHNSCSGSGTHIRNSIINSNVHSCHTNSIPHSHFSEGSAPSQVNSNIISTPPITHTYKHDRRQRPPITAIWFSSSTLHPSAELQSVTNHSTHNHALSTDSFSMYSTNRLWAETLAEMGIHYSPTETNQSLSNNTTLTPDDMSITYSTRSYHSSRIDNTSPHNLSSSSISTKGDISDQPWYFSNLVAAMTNPTPVFEVPSKSTSESDQSDHLSPSERQACNNAEHNKILRSQQQIYADLFLQYESTSGIDTVNTSSSYPNRTDDCILSDVYPSHVPDAASPNDIPSTTIYFPSISHQMRRHRPYLSYPNNDEWSVSSISSDSTNTTRASTTFSTPDVIDTTTEPFHNPRFLGCLNYYFPWRLQPLSTDCTTAGIPVHSSHDIDGTTPLSNEYNHSPINPRHTSHYPRIDAEDTSSPSFHEDEFEFVAPIPNNIGEAITLIDTSTVITPSPVIPLKHPCNNTEYDPFFQSTLDSCGMNFQDSSTTVRSNESWGDPIDVKCTNTVRIYFQNVNSFRLS